MTTLHSTSTKWQAMVSIYDTTLQQTFEETKQDAVVYNRQQLYTGIKSDGSKLSPHYATLQYSTKKYGLNSKPGLSIPDLYVTGAFYNGIGVVVNQKSLTFDSSDTKSAKLELEYTSQIYGLTAQNKSRYSLGSVKPNLFNKLKTQVM